MRFLKYLSHVNYSLRSTCVRNIPQTNPMFPLLGQTRLVVPFVRAGECNSALLIPGWRGHSCLLSFLRVRAASDSVKRWTGVLSFQSRSLLWAFQVHSSVQRELLYAWMYMNLYGIVIKASEQYLRVFKNNQFAFTLQNRKLRSPILQ